MPSPLPESLPAAVVDRALLHGRGDQPFTLPDDQTADAVLASCAVEPADRADTLAARPDPRADPDLWWLLGCLVDELAVTLDTPVGPLGFASWPALPASTGPVGRHLYVWALVHAVGALRGLHADRGIHGDVTHATLATLGETMRDHREATGASGLGLRSIWSMPLQLRGAEVLLGRHAFTRAEVAFGDGVDGHVLHVHVPAHGRLDRAASDASFAQARTFFPTHYPDEPLAWFFCTSWMLDPQLRDHLDARSNILGFAERFTLLPARPVQDPDACDRELLRSVFGVAPPAAGPVTEAELTQVGDRTSFQRAYVAHLRSGHHWHKRAGVIAFATGGAQGSP